MDSTNGSIAIPDAVRRVAPFLAFGLGLCCLLAMVPVTLGALAGVFSIGAAVPALAVGAAVSIVSLVAA
ncbi:hypothetical protein [Halolamina salifodinae]|uniref:Uncharacterized protein n=1 Tax=Halolamina salifodinae TaxID=1202767 RepID=A0A8T4GYC3_9EURY|nr:hypothetical protein [Halolamina salifodinae]MBP1988027.1 hypothetical protein [Halolamina salifodinae]